MAEIGEPFDPDDDRKPPCTGEGCKKDRLERQMQETAAVIDESANVIDSALRRLSHASKELRASYGDAPFADLER